MKKFNEATEDIFIEFILQSQEVFEMVIGITKPEYFCDRNKKVVAEIIDHASKYNKLPSREQLKAGLGLTHVGNENFDPSDPAQREWFLNEYPEFCKGRAYGLAFRDSLEDLNDGNYDAVPDKINAVADQVVLINDLGREVGADPKASLWELLQETEKTSTGWPSVDRQIGGGFSKGELNIFMGVSGEGKSVFLANTALNFALKGMNSVYVSLEMSEAEIEMRLLRMLTGWSEFRMKNNALEAVEVVKEARAAVAGKIFIKQLPAKTISATYIKGLIKEFRRSEIPLDMVVVDYLDLMDTNDRRKREKFDHDEHVSIELRNVAVTEDVFLATASQMNRSGMQTARDSGQFGFDNIAGGVSKAYTAGNVMAIRNSREMRKDGQTELQFIKTRNSTNKESVKLNFNKDSLRITDPDVVLDPHRPDATKDFNALLTADDLQKQLTEMENVVKKLESSGI